MTEQRRQAARDSAHRLRSRLTYLLLCSHTLKSDLRDRLSAEERAELQQLEGVVHETKALLQTLLKQFEPELKTPGIKNMGGQMIGRPRAMNNLNPI
jgi:hypothetical protein